jgi:hypothetical protein
MPTLDEQLKAANLPVLGTAIEGTTVLFTRELTPAERDTYESIINPEWHEQEQMRRSYQTTLDGLQQIVDAPTLTNAQVLTAIKFMARTLKAIVKIMAKKYVSTG